MPKRFSKGLPEKTLRIESISTKIVVELIIFFVIVILPYFIPFELPYHAGLKWNITIALSLAVFYHFLTLFQRHKGKDIKRIYLVENVTDTLMMSHLLHLFGRINGPLFFFYGFTIMESALNLDVVTPFLIATTAIIASLGEFIFLVSQQEITFTAPNILLLILRGAFVFLMARYGRTLAETVVHERDGKIEIQKLADGLRKANLELRKLDKAKSEFISIASHQLRTPLSIIKGYVSMMLEGSFGKISEKLGKILGKVYLSNERLIRLVNHLLNLSRIEGGRFKYDFKVLSLEKIVSKVVSEMRFQAGKKNLSIEFMRPKKKLPLIRIDADKVEDVIINLIDNAIRYTKEGKIVVGLEKEPKRNSLLFSVKDTGVGLSREEQKNLFQKFIRGKEISKIHTEGVGIGLYVAKIIVKAHHGKIWAKSDGRNKGSAFYVRMPFRG